MEDKQYWEMTSDFAALYHDMFKSYLLMLMKADPEATLTDAATIAPGMVISSILMTAVAHPEWAAGHVMGLRGTSSFNHDTAQLTADRVVAWLPLPRRAV